MKKIGVVIPIYNTDKYLRECIESVINQTYKNIEIALVDDGSTDDSGKICDEYAKKDGRIKVIHQENLGAQTSRYNGATAIDYDYLTFVDSDDWILPNTYEKFTEQMENDIDVIAWQYILYYNNEKQKVVPCNYQSGFYDYERYKKEIYPNVIWNYEKNASGIGTALWDKLIKKSLALKALKNAQSIKNIAYGEDSAVLFPLLKEVKTLYLSDESLYYYRQKEKNEAPEYFKDENFFEKLLILHKYFLKIFSGEPFMIKQLDTLFAKRVICRNNSLNYNVKISSTLLFPFNKIPFGKNIIIYGAGLVGQTYYKSIKTLKYANKILWVDKNYLKYKEFGVKSIECLNEATDYDYIVVAIENEDIAKEIITYLSNVSALSQTQIVWEIHRIFESV